MVKLQFPIKSGLALTLSMSLFCVAAPTSAQNLYAQEATRLELTFSRLMSSLRIKAQQVGSSGRQVAVTSMKSSEAHASAITTVAQRLSVLNGATDYGLGRDQSDVACSVTNMRAMAAQTGDRVNALLDAANVAEQEWVAQNRSATETQVELTNQRQNYYCPEEEFAAGLCGQLAGQSYNTGVGAGDTNASVFMDGNAGGAEEIAVGMDFVDRIAPLPTIVENQNLETAVQRVVAIRKSASISMARTLLAGSVFEGIE